MDIKNLKTVLISGIVLISLTSSTILEPGQKETKIRIHTTKGDMVVKLYDETPQTRDNFIKLVKQKFYDSVLFHRVIQGFMIQAGDPKSKNAVQGVMLGNGDIGYTIPAEIKPDLYHKKGALACARTGDDVNPSKASSGCQFYIAQGKVYSDAELTQMEDRMNFGIKQQIFTTIINKPENADKKKKFMEYQNKSEIDSLRALAATIEPEIDSIYAKSTKFSYSPEQRKAYTTIGGVPHLDGNYTVFGEVVEGLNIVDSIAAVKTGAADRPVQDVRIISMEIVK
ncbi:MAG TPA: peptidylprolyl isomerase [Bacteroidia bacterium]|jgi:peptidylprolyl isomerase|nr:peptidylprolyl isomerase [Bacteroidia bacterium]